MNVRKYQQMLPLGWRMISLSDKKLFSFESGTWKSEKNPRNCAIIRNTNFKNDGSLDLSVVSIIPVDSNLVDRKKLEYGDIIIEKSGGSPTQPVGRVVYFGLTKETYLFSNFTCRLRVIDNTQINPRYLHLFLLRFHYRGGTRKLQRKTTGIINLNLNEYKKIQIPLPPLETQNRIVSILERADSLKQKRRQANENADKLLRNVFVEMFGDPARNPKKWPTKKLKDIAEIKTGGTPSRDISDYWENGEIPWIKTTEIREGTITETEEKITQKGLDHSNAVVFPKGTLLIAMYGQGKTRGRTAKLGIDASTNQACAAILPSKNYNIDFVFHYLQFSYERLRTLGRGGNQPNLNLSMVKNFEIYFPPNDDQNKFSDIVKYVESIKKGQNFCSAKIDFLFDSLMNRAFSGELVT